MQEDPTSSQTATLPHPSDSPPLTPRTLTGIRRIGAIGAIGKRAFHSAFSWPPDGWLPIPTVTSLLLVALVTVAVVEVLPKGISDVTLSIRARTEALKFELDPARKYVWWLPGGSYSLVKKTAGDGCEARSRFDFVCSSTEPTAVVITNGATVRLETIPPDDRGGGFLGGPVSTAPAGSAARFSIVITPRTGMDSSEQALAPAAAGAEIARPSTVEIRGQSDLLAETHDLVTFESGPVDLWRIPLILKRVEIGESLTESIAASETLGGFRQPIMTAGDVRIFARSFGSKKRYQVQEESFDPADVVQIPADGDPEGLLLGLISLQNDDQQFDLTLHTDLAEIFVRRLGAEHRIGVSTWSIVSQVPFWLALWIVWVSLIVVANYHAQRLGVIRGSPNAAKRK